MLSDLEKKIGYTYKKKSLAENALTHSSYANEVSGRSSNERLEFLGDSVLGIITAEYLYRSFKHLPEGELTKLRSSLVCEKSLVNFARGDRPWRIPVSWQGRSELRRTQQNVDPGGRV